MTEFKEEWTVQAAMEILQHPTVDSKIWAEAVEWLLLYGPPEIKSVLQASADHAAKEEFPDLRAESFTEDGELCYKVADLAKALGISEEEAGRMIAAKEQAHGIRQLFGQQETKKMQ